MAGSLSPAGVASTAEIAWPGPYTLNPGAPLEFRFRGKITAPIAKGETQARLGGVTFEYTQSGVSGSQTTDSAGLNLTTKTLVLAATPSSIAADGKSTAQVLAIVTSNGVPAVHERVSFHTIQGLFISTDETADTTALTDSAGKASVTLRADTESGKATITAQWDAAEAQTTVIMLQDALTLSASTAVYTRIPGSQFGATMKATRSFASGVAPEATLYGWTEIPVTVQYTSSDPNANLQGKKIQLSCGTTGLGSARLNFPESVSTDASGQATFTVALDDLWKAETSLDGIILAAQLDGDAAISGQQRIDWFDNLGQVLDYYWQWIPRGLVWENAIWTEVEKRNPTIVSLYQSLLQRTGMAGHVNNALSSVLFDWVGNNWNNQFDPYVCGSYQAQVLTMLCNLRLNTTGEGQTDWLMNGLDYGPLFVLGGEHVATMIYPRVNLGQAEWKNDDTRVLDPWLTQEPAIYTWKTWKKMLAASFVNTVVEPFIDCSSILPLEYNHMYPCNGYDYPNISTPAPANAKRKVAQILCPVQAWIEDASGRQAGYVGSAMDGTLTAVQTLTNASFSVVAEADGSPAWFFTLPSTAATLHLRSVSAGEITLLMPAASGTLLRYRVTANGSNETGQLQLASGPGEWPALEWNGTIPIVPEVFSAPCFSKIDVGGGKVSLSFDAMASRVYSVQYRPALGTGDWRLLQSVGPLETGAPQTITDAATSSQRYYRLKID